MSLWSAIGLADRKTVDTLLSEIRSLRNENQTLITENQNLLIEKISRECAGLSQTEAKETEEIKSLISEVFHDLWVNVENTSKRRERQISMEGESVRKAIIAAKEQTDGRLSEIKNNVETTLQNLDSSRKESELRKAAVTAEIEKAANHLDNVLNHMENEYSSSINHVLEQQKMEIHKLEAVEKSYRDSMLQMKKNYSDAFEEIMKAVWVGSLLNEYKREIESEIKPAKV